MDRRIKHNKLEWGTHRVNVIIEYDDLISNKEAMITAIDLIKAESPKK